MSRGSLFARKVVHFVRYARGHRILVNGKDRLLGVISTLTGWALIALSVVLSRPVIVKMPSSVFLFVLFLSSTLTLLIGSLCLGKKVFVMKEAHLDDEEHSRGGHLTVRERKWLLIIRGTIAVVGYMMLVLASKVFNVVDNSAMFGLDALFYALIMAFVLKESVRPLQWLGIILVTVGAITILGYDSQAHYWRDALAAGGAGIAASLAMAIIVLMQTVMIRYELPLRIALVQCGIGLLIASVLLVIFLIRNGVSPVLAVPWREYFVASGNGVFYAISLLCFFRAFYWTEPIAITLVGFSLEPMTLIFALSTGLELTYPPVRAVINLIFILGGVISVYDEYRADRGKAVPSKSIPVQPLHRAGLRKQMADLRQEFRQGLIDMYEYLARRHEFNKLLFQFSKEIGDTDLSKIEINSKDVIFTVKPYELKLASDGAARSAPLEALNFGSYEPNETFLLSEFVSEQAVVLDIGAHIGWHSITLAKLKPAAQIFAFEPVPNTFKFLQQNISLNDVHNVECFNWGFLDYTGSIDFHYFQGGSALASPRNLIGHDKTELISCKMQTIDEFVSDKHLSQIDLIKCDVEGCELAVVKGGLKSIQAFKPIIMIELYEEWCEQFGYSAFDVKKILESCGYDCYLINGQYLSKENCDFTNSSNYNYVFLDPKVHSILINRFAVQSAT